MKPIIMRNEEGGWFIRDHPDLGVFTTQLAALDYWNMLMQVEERAENDAATARSGEELLEDYFLLT